MRYTDFRKSFPNPLFSSQDIRLLAAKITPSQLTLWQKQDYITKIRGGVYIFNDAKSKLTPEELSAVLVEPSYISLETVLSRHSLIPEMVFTTTCITTKNTRSYQTYLGAVSYSHIKQDLFFGYDVVNSDIRPYHLATAEKALLDFFYLHPQYKDQGDIEGLRIEPSLFSELNPHQLDQYVNAFPPRVKNVLQVIRSMHD